MSHSHSHGGGCHDEHHDHSGGDGHTHDDDITPALQSSLYRHIDFDKIRTFNESVPDSGRAIIQKPWDARLSHTPFLESDADEQLLIFIPFTGQVKLHSILVRPPPTPAGPKTIKLFINRDGMDFDVAAETTPVQTLEVPMMQPGLEYIEIPVQRARFNAVHSLTVFVEDNQSDGEVEETQILWMGFKGDWMQVNRGAVEVLYEAAANPKDHKNLVPGGNMGMMGN